MNPTLKKINFYKKILNQNYLPSKQCICVLEDFVSLGVSGVSRLFH